MVCAFFKIGRCCCCCSCCVVETDGGDEVFVVQLHIASNIRMTTVLARVSIRPLRSPVNSERPVKWKYYTVHTYARYTFVLDHQHII